jgi:hypothetical protein
MESIHDRNQDPEFQEELTELAMTEYGLATRKKFAPLELSSSCLKVLYFNRSD